MKLQSLKDVKRALKYMENLKNKNRNKGNYLYSKFDKTYKKIDWSSEKIDNHTVRQILQNNVMMTYDKLVENKKLRFFSNGCRKEGYYLRSNVQNLLLVQELMSQMDDRYWMKKSNEKWKPEYVPFYFDSVYRGKIWICQIPITKIEKSKLVTEFLHTKEYLFDEDCPFFKGHNKTRNFIEKNLFNGKVEKWDYYLKRFLSENN